MNSVVPVMIQGETDSAGMVGEGGVAGLKSISEPRTKEITPPMLKT